MLWAHSGLDYLLRYLSLDRGVDLKVEDRARISLVLDKIINLGVLNIQLGYERSGIGLCLDDSIVGALRLKVFISCNLFWL